MIDGGALVIVFRPLRRSSTHLPALATDKSNRFNTVGTTHHHIHPNPHNLNLNSFSLSTHNTSLTVRSIPRLSQGLCMSSISHVSKASSHWSMKVGIVGS